MAATVSTSVAPPAPEAGGVDAGERRRWITLALLIGAQFVVVLDAAIVTVALPSIAADLRFAQQDLSWVVNAYLLTFGGFLLLGAGWPT
jgi:MFS family permease